MKFICEAAEGRILSITLESTLQYVICCDKDLGRCT